MFCRVCFRKNMKVYYKLNNNYIKLMGTLSEVKIEANETVCSFCLTTLGKIQKFINAVKEVDTILKLTIKAEEFYSLSVSTHRNISIECPRALCEVYVCSSSDALRDRDAAEEVKDELQQPSDDFSSIDHVPLMTVPDIRSDNIQQMDESIDSNDKDHLAGTNTITAETEKKTNSFCSNKKRRISLSPGSNCSVCEDSDRDTRSYSPSAESCSDKEEVDDAPLKRCRLEELQDFTTSNIDELSTKPSGHRLRRIRTKDYCFFCENVVLNFARHVTRHHSMESEVQKILSYPKKSCSRKKLLSNLRKRGNYIMNVGKCLKPMKKSNTHPNVDYLPCENCLGFYSRKQLWKHKKVCQPLSKTSKAQVDSQNFLLRSLDIDKNLKDLVFPKMRPDRISLEAKKDSLICAFGAQYLRNHREENFISVTSRRMRELAKLLIELKKLKPSLEDLMDCLKPQHYDIIVTATKKVARYDDSSDRYGAPGYAMNISASLKQCCNIAIRMSLKSDSKVETAAKGADLKTLIQLIEENWKFDVSSQACSELNLRNCNKITIVPLASDLQLLKNHLDEKSKSTASKLAESGNDNIEAYTTLLETVFCRIFLLNRRRPGELQNILVSNYQKCKKGNNHEEFERAISSTERILLNSFKGILIRGQYDQAVPLLFTDEVQNDIDLLISVRHNYINDQNKNLFAKPGSETALCGYKVLEKYAKSCGAKNPQAITATKLWKHSAMLTQLFNLNDSAIEQLGNFMGLGLHGLNYRLPDDVHQTAKLSKLLLLMEGGNSDYYKGKSFDDIDLDLEQDLLQDVVDENDETLEYEAVLPSLKSSGTYVTDDISVDTHNVTDGPKTRIKKKRNLIPWTSQQKQIVTSFFSKHIKSKQSPRRQECEDLRRRHPDVLDNKDWLKIKVFVQNTYTKNNK